MTRISQIIWMYQLPDEVAADLLEFFGIWIYPEEEGWGLDDVPQLRSGPRLFSLVANLPIRNGSVKDRFEKEQLKLETGNSVTPRAPSKISPELSRIAEEMNVEVGPPVNRGTAGEVGGGDAASFMAMFNSQYQSIRHDPDAR